ncbi:MAG TPA: glycosyltransferase family 25 protein [Burkholderiaceae bacterium]|nr:glycosyltransferase family 25 protein [Burkholderiaceae bacterium]
MYKPPIYIISLAGAEDRRSFMREQLAKLDVRHEFFDAVHGARQPDHPLFSRYNDIKRAERRGANASLRPAQLGCFASHYLLWEKCVALKHAIIVLEDDAILLPSFAAFHAKAHEFAQRYGLVWLQPSRKVLNQAGHHLEQIGHFTVKKFAKGFSGTTGYLITPTTAQALLTYSSEWLYPVDNTMDRFYDHKVEAIGIDPFCVTQDDDFESTINIPDNGTRHSLSDKAHREWANLKDTWKRQRHNLAFRITARMGRRGR